MAIEIMTQETEEAAKEVYNRVPRLLKEKVKAILIDAGMEGIISINEYNYIVGEDVV